MEVVLNNASGIFVYAYNESAYVVGYIMEYKVLDNTKVGFPEKSLDKVTSKLQSYGISFKVVDPLLNVISYYESDDNNFDKYYNKARNAVQNKQLINKVNAKLLDLTSVELEKLLDGMK